MQVFTSLLSLTFENSTVFALITPCFYFSICGFCSHLPLSVHVIIYAITSLLIPQDVILDTPSISLSYMESA